MKKETLKWTPQYARALLPIGIILAVVVGLPMAAQGAGVYFMVPVILFPLAAIVGMQLLLHKLTISDEGITIRKRTLRFNDIKKVTISKEKGIMRVKFIFELRDGSSEEFIYGSAALMGAWVEEQRLSRFLENLKGVKVSLNIDSEVKKNLKS